MTKRIIGLVVILSALIEFVAAQNPVLLKVGKNSDFSVTVSTPPFNLKTEVSNAKFYIKFYFGDKQYEKIADGDLEKSLTLTCDLDLEDAANQIIESHQIELNIKKLEPEQWIILEHKGLSVDEFRFKNIVLANPSALPITPTVYIQGFNAVDYSIDVKMPNDAQPLAITQNKVDIPENSRFVTFTWNNKGFLYPAYQFQLVRLYNDGILNPSPVNDYSINASKIDWSKALTLEVYDNGDLSAAKTLNLAVIEGTGYYAWRVRPIGNYYGKLSANDSRNYGEWSSTPTSLVATNPNSLGNNMFFLQEPEDDKNWSYNRVFSEKNEPKEIIQFATGLNFISQTQTHLYSSGEHGINLVTQSVTDYTGRACISTIPVPIEESNLNNYKTDFFLNNNNQLYTAKDFDQEGNYDAPAKNSELNSFEYYNGERGDYVPDAGQYAFSRVLYYNDGTGRVKEQSGVGTTHSIGKDANQGRTTRFYYTSPTEAELITLFGVEAASTNSVIKITTIDPNGIASVQYKGKDGKLLATAIQDNPNDSPLLELDENENDFNQENLNKLVISSKSGLLSSKRFVLTHDGNIHLKYTGLSQSFWSKVDMGSCISGNCKYNLTIKIIDLDKFDDVGYIPTEFTLPEPVTKDNPGFLDKIVSLNAGEYLIVKELRPAEDGSNVGYLSAKNLGAQLKPVTNTIIYWLTNYVATETEPWTLDYFYQSVSMSAFQNNIDANTEKFFDELKASGDISGYDDPELFSKLEITSLGIIRDAVTNEPKKLRIGTICGVPLEVDLKTYAPAYTCEDIPEPGDINEAYYIANFTNGAVYDFEAYMRRELKVSNVNDFYSINLPGYNVGDFNRMIFHMLTDSYAENGLGSPSRQYKCQQLWTCWINVINTFKNQQDATGQQADIANEVDNEAGGDGNVLNDHFDNNYKPKFGGRLVKWFMKKLLSWRMRKHSGDHKVSVDIKMNLPYLFLKCTGYKFASIVDDELSIATSNVFPEDLADYQRSGGKNMADMPFIKSSIFAFKYYEYNSKIIDRIYPFPDYYYGCQACQVFQLYDKEIFPDCFPIDEADFVPYRQWGFSKRQEYYNCIVDCPEMPEASDELATCPTPAEQADLLLAENENCKTVIQQREPEIRRKIREVMLANGFTLSGCAGNNKVISAELINSMASRIITLSQEKCSLSSVNCQEFRDCEYQYITIDYGTPQEREAMYKAMYGNLQLSLPTGQCTDGDATLHVEKGVITNP